MTQSIISARQLFQLIPGVDDEMVKKGIGSVVDLTLGQPHLDINPIVQTALREVEEECGITGLILQRFLISTYHIYLLNNDLMLKKTDWFEMKYKGESKPRPLAKEDISQTRWIKRVMLKEVYGNTYSSVIDVFKLTLPA